MKDDKIFKLPPYEVSACVSILSQKKSYSHEMKNIPAMWERTRGKGIKVVVLDTGVAEHPDLKLAGFEDFTNSGPVDRQGHGTHVCGIVGGLGHNDMGILGIAPECSLYSGKVLDDRGSGSLDWVVRGIRWAVDVVGADVINLSLGLPAGFPDIPQMKAACDYAYSKGVVVIAASGNEAGAVGQPASYSSVISVVAVDSRKSHARFSNKGPENEFAAGGVDVYSTFLRRSYAKLSGTSMAAPAISGVVALILADARNDGKTMTPDDVRKSLQKIAYDVGEEGFDELYGHGIPIFRHHEDDPNKEEGDVEGEDESPRKRRNVFVRIGRQIRRAWRIIWS